MWKNAHEYIIEYVSDTFKIWTIYGQYIDCFPWMLAAEMLNANGMIFHLENYSAINQCIIKNWERTKIGWNKLTMKL